MSFKEIFTNGFQLHEFPISGEVKTWIQNNHWENLDNYFRLLTTREGELFRFLQNFAPFENIEFIISMRDAQNEWEEDGIWHDDGSRVLAFSLSLTENPADIQGGVLGLRKKGEETFQEIPTPQFGKMIVFLTGVHGYEHKIHQVLKGRRIIIAGWCS